MMGYILVALLCVVVPYYVDSLTTRVDTATNGSSLMVDIVSSITAACFVSIYRGNDPFAMVNVISSSLIIYGIHLLSAGGRPSISASSSSPSSSVSSLDANLPLFTSRDRYVLNLSLPQLMLFGKCLM